MSTAPDDGTVLALGRRYRSVWDRFDALDRQHLTMSDDAPDKALIGSYADRAATERQRLFERVFTRRCETLADAAVMAAHGFSRADVMLDGTDLMDALMNGRLNERLGQMRWAFATILTVTAKAAPLDLCQIGAPDLVRRVNLTLNQRT